MMRTAILVLLIFSSPQDRAGKLLERWRSDDPAERERATDEALGKWKEWTAPDLENLDRIAGGTEAEAAARAKELAARIRLRRRAGEEVTGQFPDIDRVFLRPGEDDPIDVLHRTVGLWKKGILSYDGLRAVAGLAAERPWKERANGILLIVEDRRLVPFRPLIPPLLNHPDPRIRALSAKEMGNHRIRGHEGALVALLRDKDDVVASAAVEALRILGAGDRTETIVSLLREADPGLRRRGIETLERIKARSAAALIADALDDADPGVRLEALGALGSMEATEQVRRILPFLKDDYGHFRAEAIGALQRMKARDQAEAIAALLKDSDREVRRRAIGALGELGAEKYREALAAFLKDEDDYLCSAAVKALTSLGAREYLPAMVALMQGKEDVTGVPGSVQWAIYRFRSREHYGLIARDLESKESTPFWNAARSLSRLDGHEFVPRIAARIGDEDDLIAGEAVNALGSLGAAEHAGILFDMLKGKDLDILDRGPVISALCGLVSGKHRERVLGLLDEEMPGCRGAGVTLLVLLGSRDSLDRIVSITSSEKDRPLALEPMALWGDRRHVPLIRPFLRSPEPSVRGTAALYLAKLLARIPPLPEDERSIEDLRKLEKNLGPMDRFPVSAGLIRLGRLDRPDQRQVVADLLELDYYYEKEVCDSLLFLHEKEISGCLDREVETGKRVASGRDLAELLGQAGLVLEDGEKVRIENRMPAGIRRTARDAIGWIVGYRDVIVPQGKGIRIARPEEGLKYWRDRLEGR